jgi:arylsulfatase A-like enzyme
MAREGLRLTSHYAAPVCSPSRASLLTGCYPKRVLPIPHVLFPGSAVGLAPAERTIAEILKDAGYATACIGKWHVGDQLDFLPTRQGFDYYFGLPYSNDMGPAADGTKSNPPDPIPDASVVAARAAKAKNQGGEEFGIRINQPPLPLLENESIVERVRRPEQFTLTTRLTDKAVDFIRKNRARPFFLYLPHVAVHFPLHPGPEFAGRSRNKALGDWVEEIDANVGRVLDTLRDLGLERNTLVVFTSDNGGSVPHGSNNAPLRGTKGQVYEGGIRACTIVRWPGRIPAGRSTDAITSHMDWLPTFVRFAKAKLPADRTLDGVDLSALFVSPDAADAGSRRETFHYFRGLNLEAIRSGPWKLHLGSGELYDLNRDIGEKTNLASAQPAVVDRLRALARDMERDLGTSGEGAGVRPIGRVARPEPILSRAGQVRADMKSAQAVFP